MQCGPRHVSPNGHSPSTPPRVHTSLLAAYLHTSPNGYMHSSFMGVTISYGMRHPTPPHTPRSLCVSQTAAEAERDVGPFLHWTLSRKRALLSLRGNSSRTSVGYVCSHNIHTYIHVYVQYTYLHVCSYNLHTSLMATFIQPTPIGAATSCKLLDRQRHTQAHCLNTVSACSPYGSAT